MENIIIIAFLSIMTIIATFASVGLWLLYSKLTYIENVMKQMEREAQQEAMNDADTHYTQTILVSPN